MTVADGFVDLKEHPEFLDAYVRLRNRYADVLRTQPVSVGATVEWLNGDGIEVVVRVEGGELVGAAILYLDRGGEIAFFVADPGRGNGPRALTAIEAVARERGLVRVWAFVLSGNERASRAFRKSGYAEVGETRRLAEGSDAPGTFFAKSVA
jgi:RimJ/RimL family protein N-acetyltransferase